MGSIDTIIVPDFSGEETAVFEARTLFFLGSWLEAGGTSDLKICSIGDSPTSVRRLAEQAGATVSTHRPLEGFYGNFANKLRGLEVGGEGGAQLLLDADTLILGEIRDVDEAAADISAAPAGKPQAPLSVWRSIYAALGMTMPTERMESVRGRLGLGLEDVAHRYQGQAEEAGEMLPYYNSGALLVRRGCGLRQVWEDHLRRIAAAWLEHPEWVAYESGVLCDQAALATSIQALRGQGRSFALLPEVFNLRPVHFRAGALRWGEGRVLHATGFLRGLKGREDLRAAMEQYADRLAGAISEGRERVGLPFDTAANGQPRVFLRQLWERWVRPAWEG